MKSTKEELGYKTDGRKLLAEIEPLLKDYFIADFLMTEDGLVMKLENGQKFKLLITEISDPQ